MKSVFYPSVTGECNMCKSELQGGYLIFDKYDNISKVLCTICKETEESIDLVTEKKKRSKLTVRKVNMPWYARWVTWIWGEYYQVISSKNLIFTNDLLKQVDLVKYLDDPHTDLEVKL